MVYNFILFYFEKLIIFFSILFIISSGEFEIPNSNTDWYSLKKDVNTNILIERYQRMNTQGSLEKSTFNVRLQKLHEIDYTVFIYFPFLQFFFF